MDWLFFPCQIPETNWNLRRGTLREKEKKIIIPGVYYFTLAFPPNSLSSASLKNLFYCFAHIHFEFFNVLAKVKILLFTLEIILRPFLFISLWLEQTLVHKEPCLKSEG